MTAAPVDHMERLREYAEWGGKDSTYQWALDEIDRLCDALNGILTTVEDANRPYERLTIGALARAGLGET